MNRLYHISFEVNHRNDFFENYTLNANSYVVAECPYQALFLVRNRLAKTPWVNNPSSETWELLNAEQLDRTKHSMTDIMDAVQGGLVVVRVSAEQEMACELALPA